MVAYTELSYATKQTSFTPATPIQTCMAVSESLLIISLHPWGAVSCAYTVHIQLAGDNLKHRMAGSTNVVQELKSESNEHIQNRQHTNLDHVRVLSRLRQYTLRHNCIEHASHALYVCIHTSATPVYKI